MATYNKAAMQYQRNAIQTASPAKLTLMLYDGAIKFANMAIEAMDRRERVMCVWHLFRMSRS